MTDSNQGNDYTEAWAFVLRHSELMDRLGRRFGPPEDRAEWKREVMVYIVERFHRYDPAKSAPQTWITWQMRAVTKMWTRAWKRRCLEGYGKHETMAIMPLGPSMYGSVEHQQAQIRRQDAAALATALYVRASEKQKVAIKATIAGLKAAELKEQCSMTHAQRRSHLRALRPYCLEAL